MQPISALPAQRILCHVCGHTHECAHNAEKSQCPNCGQSISFENVVVNSHVSRSIDTRGTLRIEKTGNLYGPFTICRNAIIHGMISGALHCEEKATLHGRGTYPVKIHANELLIPGGAEVFCPFPIRARHVVIRGVLRAPLLVESRLEILRKGHLVGAVCARSIHVDRGGELRGQIRIGPGSLPLLSTATQGTASALRPRAGSRFQNARPRYTAN